jgi:spore coat polysaccharide biosynthesis protein SpsF
VVVVIQARMGSTRLPGKVLLPLGGRTLLAHVVERAALARGVDEVRVATSDSPRDDVVAAETRRCGAALTRGSEQDVLARYAQAAREAAADVVVRVTSDCPLLAPELVERAVAQLRSEGADYVSNTRKRPFPRGLDVEVLRREALEAAAREAREPAEREHVTPFVWRRPERFRLADLRAEPDEEAPGFRLTVDEPADYAAVCAVAQLLPPGDPSARALARVLRHAPWLGEVNAHVAQKPV